MWQSLLKEHQPDVLVPPGFKKIQVLGTNTCTYNINISRNLSNWAFVDSSGKFKRYANDNEVYTGLTNYPTIHCCFLQKDTSEDYCWLVCINNNILKMRFVPDFSENIQPLTTIIAKGLGGVLSFYSFNYRDMQPWYVDNALEILHSKDLKKDTTLTWLREDQRFAFAVLIENELANRIPKPEQQIKNIISKEGANLISMNKNKNGYSIEFRYKGSIRRISVNEDLTLRDAGMCLSGRDKDYSLDSFIAVLQYEDRRSEFPGY